MDKVKNLIRIKDVPSNVIEEAILILKENKKAKNYQNNYKNFSYKNGDTDEIAIKEAEFIISNYMENEGDEKNNKKSKKIKRLRITNIVLTIFLIISIIL